MPPANLKEFWSNIEQAEQLTTQLIALLAQGDFDQINHLLQQRHQLLTSTLSTTLIDLLSSQQMELLLKKVRQLQTQDQLLLPECQQQQHTINQQLQAFTKGKKGINSYQGIKKIGMKNE